MAVTLVGTIGTTHLIRIYGNDTAGTQALTQTFPNILVFYEGDEFFARGATDARGTGTIIGYEVDLSEYNPAQ